MLRNPTRKEQKDWIWVFSKAAFFHTLSDICRLADFTAKVKPGWIPLVNHKYFMFTAPELNAIIRNFALIELIATKTITLRSLNKTPVYEKDYHGFVYLWIDIKRHKFCVGSHMGAIDDGYTTSTGFCYRAIKKRPTTFKRFILYFHPNSDRKELYNFEQKSLDCIFPDAVFYNKKFTACGGTNPGPRPFKWRENIRIALSNSKKMKEWRTKNRHNISGLIESKKRKRHCTFCHKDFDFGNHAKYHGPKCRQNPNVDKEMLKQRTEYARKIGSWQR